ncbi:MAG: GNAT family N-acetyltransferase [Alphaproteobacteria bacterium]|nr:GNAT family N-acetyltransferase [Alphaproteobacteria bacterium]MBU0795959.1 GNAT family N-acetyltransferase [Alphaproteobacteria bacterium]MBU0886488.1 GNAT family N-acetyltransferase [Alphaproteobacteria bacterium]MBU1812289.1 GNAT family N-acetyltransferase [Alphaproteobacteria bacterium]
MDVKPVTLEGRHVTLAPLSMSAHLEGLAAAGAEPKLWRYSPTAATGLDGMRAYLQEALDAQATGAALVFTTIDKASGRIAGSSRYAAIDRKNKRLEIGWTWIDPAFQRSHVNTEAKLLMLQHAFEVLGCMRVEFKTDQLNTQSQTALARLGAVQEGIFRKHMIMPDGRIRHSIYFSILDEEWPGVKARLLTRLDQGGHKG